jgi:hypothetical protein
MEISLLIMSASKAEVYEKQQLLPAGYGAMLIHVFLTAFVLVPRYLRDQLTVSLSLKEL